MFRDVLMIFLPVFGVYAFYKIVRFLDNRLPENKGAKQKKEKTKISRLEIIFTIGTAVSISATLILWVIPPLFRLFEMPLSANLENLIVHLSRIMWSVFICFLCVDAMACRH